MTALIKTRGLELSFGATPILRDMDFAIFPGEIVTIVGPNGSGKSSFLRLLIRALEPDRGLITHKPGLKIGYVPQKLMLDPVMPLTVQNFLTLSGGEQSRELFELTGVKTLQKRQISSLSGGELQRVLLTQALMVNPDILVLDEPTQGLDQPGTAGFYKLIHKTRDQLDCAVLMVSHDLHVVMSGSDRVICLNGHICCEGTPMVVSEAPEYRALFGAGTAGTMALYRHDHNHDHDHTDHNHLESGS